MKKLLFLMKDLNRAGTEIATLNLIKNLPLEKYQINVAYINDNPNQEMIEDMAGYANVFQIKDEYETDILIYVDYGYDDNFKLSNVKRDKTFHWLHYFGREERCIFYDDEYINNLNGIICVGSAGKENLLLKKYMQDRDIPIHMIYNIMDIENIVNKSKEDCDIQLDTKVDLKLVTVARLNFAKGYRRMSCLADFLNEQNINFTWHIIGQAFSKEIEFEIKGMFAEFKDKIFFLGEKENPYNIISQCDYLVLLSDNEMRSLVISEALILGVPCIVTDFDSAYEQIKDGENGIILSRDDSLSYKNRVNDILNKKNYMKLNINNVTFDNENSMKMWFDILI